MKKYENWNMKATCKYVVLCIQESESHAKCYSNLPVYCTDITCILLWHDCAAVNMHFEFFAAASEIAFCLLMFLLFFCIDCLVHFRV